MKPFREHKPRRFSENRGLEVFLWQLKHMKTTRCGWRFGSFVMCKWLTSYPLSMKQRRTFKHRVPTAELWGGVQCTPYLQTQRGRERKKKVGQHNKSWFVVLRFPVQRHAGEYKCLEFVLQGSTRVNVLTLHHWIYTANYFKDIMLKDDF